MSQTYRPHHPTRIALLGACALFSLAACRLGPLPPEPMTGAPGADAAELVKTWEAALSADSGEVTVVLTEQQLTAFVTSRISQAERPVIDRAQIYLRNGEISIYGVAELGPLEAGTVLVVQPVLDPEGTVAFEITSAKLGPLPAPQTIMSGLSELLTEAFTGKLGPLATGIRITSLAIADGQVAIVGSLR